MVTTFPASHGSSVQGLGLMVNEPVAGTSWLPSPKLCKSSMIVQLTAS